MRATAGVGYTITNELVRNLEKSEIMEMWLGQQDKTTIAIAYGPNKKERTNKKGAFWEELTKIVENINDRLTVLGDLI